jgi:preprotein translocase subunit SecG
MEILRTIVYVLMLFSAVGIVILVLLQHGKGADMGTGFGAGASGSLFGASGSANFLSRSTAALAVLFFACTLALSYFATNRPRAPVSDENLLPAQSVPVAPTAPGAVPGSAPAGAAPAAPASAPAPAPAGKGNEVPK